MFHKVKSTFLVPSPWPTHPTPKFIIKNIYIHLNCFSSYPSPNPTPKFITLKIIYPELFLTLATNSKPRSVLISFNEEPDPG
jgi:hypothetical protein